MVRMREIVRRMSAVPTEGLLILVLAIAVGRDISEAQGKCNTAHDCRLDCTSSMNYSEKVEQRKQRYRSGTSSLDCGWREIYNRPGCNPANRTWSGSAFCDTCCK